MAEQILQEFNQKRALMQQTHSKIMDFDAELQEHELVLKAMQPMEPGRKCFRLVGEVLVERTVAETIPAVQQNRDNLQGLIDQLKQQLEKQQKDLAEYQAKHKIRIKGQGDADSDQPASSSKAASSSQGVLVSNK